MSHLPAVLWARRLDAPPAALPPAASYTVEQLPAALPPAPLVEADEPDIPARPLRPPRAPLAERLPDLGFCSPWPQGRVGLYWLAALPLRLAALSVVGAALTVALVPLALLWVTHRRHRLLLAAIAGGGAWLVVHDHVPLTPIHH